MKDCWKSFCIVLKTSKKSIVISILLSCVILCFFCFQIVQKSKNHELQLVNNEEKVREQYRLFSEKYKTASNQDEFLSINYSILKNYYMLELSQKYGILYTIDERIDDLNQLASQYIEINWQQQESPVLMESTYELERKLSLPYFDYIEEKIAEIDDSMDQLNGQELTVQIQNEVEKLLEQKKVYETLKTESEYANFKTVTVKEDLSLLEEIYEIPETEEELLENNTIPLYYQNYQEYLDFFSSSKALTRQKYETILNALLEDQILTSRELNTSQLYTIKDAWCVNHTYIIVIVLIIILLAVPILTQDYDTNFITQYYIHIKRNSYLIGKLSFMFLWLFLLSLIGVLIITCFAMNYFNYYIFEGIGMIQNNEFVYMNLLDILLPCLLQVFIAFSLLEGIHCLAIKGVRANILYCSVILIALGLLYIPFLMELPNLNILKAIPFSYFNFNQSIERNLLSLSQIEWSIGVMIGVVILLYGMQKILVENNKTEF